VVLPEPLVPVVRTDPKHLDQAKGLVPVLELDLVTVAALHRGRLVPAELGYLLVAWDVLLIFIIW
jgi:hypothetical protein